MKEIVLNVTDKIRQITPKEADNKKYFGIDVGVNYGKAFITRSSYKKGKYVAKAFHELTEGNHFPYFKRASLIKSITCALELNHRVFEFNTAEALFSWLAS